MAKFDEFLDALKLGVAELVDDLEDHKDDMVAASEAFIDDSKDDLEKWTKQVAEGDMSADDLEFLVKGKGDLAMINWHTTVGLTKVAVDEFRNGLLELIKKTTIDVFL